MSRQITDAELELMKELMDFYRNVGTSLMNFQIFLSRNREEIETTLKEVFHEEELEQAIHHSNMFIYYFTHIDQSLLENDDLYDHAFNGNSNKESE